MAVLTLGTDVQSLRVQRSLNDASARLSKSFERLSTGLRINSASDDAAGLAIADSLRVKARLYSGSIRNINDGISALNIIDGTLDQQASITTRLMELAEQSANGVFSTSQRTALNNEYRALVQEFGRLGDTTNFNNLNLLLGGHGSSNPNSFSIQAGTNGGTNSSLQIITADTGSFSGTINVSDLSNTVSGATTFENLMSQTGNTALLTKVTDSLGVQHDVYLTFADLGTSLRINAYMRASESNGITATDPSQWVQMLGASGVVAYDSSGQLGITSLTIGGFAGNATAACNLDLRGARVSSSSTDAAASAEALTSGSTMLSITGVETATRAAKALEIATRRLDQLSSIRGRVGAFQSRLEIARSVSDISREGNLAAESRIRDVDVAEESASVIASQILQKTAANVLKQIGLGSEVVLGLLKS